MWKTVNLRRETSREFTISVNGSYQHVGPQGTMAAVDFPCTLFPSTTSTKSRAITNPISSESFTRRKGTRRSG
jgi:hypothetical protein